MSHKYDIFISYASEDIAYVRPLAAALRMQRIAVWFDEFELRPGAGLRQSIDRGLLESRFGLVILSPAFFSKSWPQWELDGLVQLHHSRREQNIIPIWHGVDRATVEGQSPSLVNVVAIISQGDPARTAEQVLNMLRPRPTAVELARDRLVEFGFPAPILSDDWWLDAAAWSAPTFGEGTFQEAGSWGWWGFPLPPCGDSAAEKAERLAWAAMQHSWQERAKECRIVQCCTPERVLAFIENQPGLPETIKSELDFALFYAPQLAIPGAGGFLEEEIVSTYNRATVAIKGSPKRCAPGWILRESDFLGLPAIDLVERYFWPTDPAGTSPDASVLGWVDAAAWLLSTASAWLSPKLRNRLREGLVGDSESASPKGRTWPRVILGDVSAWELPEELAWREFLQRLDPGAQTQEAFLCAARPALEARIEASRRLLDLPEASSKIGEEIFSWGVLEGYWKEFGAR